MTTAPSSTRLANIVSPTTAGVLPNKVSAADAHAAGRFGHDKPRPGNSVVLLLQADWRLPTADAMLAPFIQNLAEYGFVLQNFRNNANQHAVPDPFGLVK